MIFETEFITPGGLVLECHVLMESGEPETLSEPMEPPLVELQSALVGGIDVGELLSDDLVDSIEAQALETMERTFAEMQ